MKKIFLLCFLIAAALSSSAQMAKFQALYLLQFAKNTSWPQEDNGKPFVITVVSDNDLARELKSISQNKMIGNRKVSVVEASAASGISRSDVIYLGESKNSQMGSLVSAQSGNKVLIVGSSKGLCASGAGITFVADGGKLSFEINEANIGRNGLKVTPRLYQLGKQVF
ncbi:MAG: YfiR family protein [Bacteroidales bacterium]|nr:YfiR family protein [Bacteroidales bacterium]